MFELVIREMHGRQFIDGELARGRRVVGRWACTRTMFVHYASLMKLGKATQTKVRREPRPYAGVSSGDLSGFR